ncbi:MAG: YHS domain-containing (seleno)protein [Leptolyngbyaceae bacterium]|nr:YHS domain-containing (seleno)protein [Leptolyngbyaceae bacterium]
MKIQYFAALTIASLVGIGSVSLPSIVSTVRANPCAASPCAAVDPCAANPCAAVNPCAANPCAAVDPCAANPCAANPCAANPCAAVDPCAANPCAAADPCAAAVTAAAPKIYSDPQLDQQAGQTLAIRGYDPVAYFTEGQPVEGSSAYQYEWNGATWKFSSEANLTAFVENPEAFAPQYGGYCAKALSEGNLASIDPTAWRIVDGKLYLNYSAAVQQQWVQDIPGNIALGDANWPEILTSPATVYYDTVGAVQY